METSAIWNFFWISVKNKRSSIPSTYLVGFFSRSKLNRPSIKFWSACDPVPFLHSASKTARPSFFIAELQFHKDDSDFPSELLLAFLPVLITMVLCWPTSFMANPSKDFEIEMVDAGWPTSKSTTPLEFATISIPWISKLSANFFASCIVSPIWPGDGMFSFLFE